MKLDEGEGCRAVKSVNPACPHPPQVIINGRPQAVLSFQFHLCSILFIFQVLNWFNFNTSVCPIYLVQ